MYEIERDRPNDAGEVEFNTDYPAETKPAEWMKRIAPRKPRFFNRVKLYIDWNEYNKLHYNEDNPPPKTIDGYRFNIFYPDLMDKSKTPQYRLIPMPGEPDVRLIVFQAGPPYLDVAFKVLGKPWEHSHRFGFKCVLMRL
jgi:hypothetical protein